MNTIFENFSEIHARGVVVYGHTDSKLYVDAAHTVQLEQADATNLFKKNLLVIASGENFFAPVKLEGAKVYTMNVVSETVSMVAWNAKAST